MEVRFAEAFRGRPCGGGLQGPDLCVLSAPIPAQLPLRGFAGHWISRLSAYGWRSPRQSASCKTGPSTPRAPRVWEQVTPQTGLRFCRNPAPLSGGSQRQGVVYRFLLSWGGGGREEAGSPFGLSLRAAQLGHLMERVKLGAKAGWRTGRGGGSIHCHSGALADAPGKAWGRALRGAGWPEGSRAVGHWACGEHLPQSFC